MPKMQPVQRGGRNLPLPKPRVRPFVEPLERRVLLSADVQLNVPSYDVPYVSSAGTRAGMTQNETTNLSFTPPDRDVPENWTASIFHLNGIGKAVILANAGASEGCPHLLNRGAISHRKAA